MTRLRPLALALLALATAGCAPSFEMTLPDRFVVLDEEYDDYGINYDLRATTPDGVVVGLRAIDHAVEGSQAFWVEAVTRRLRDQLGYELLAEEDVRAGSGQAGKLMRYGRDLQGHSYRYTIAVFVTDDYIWVVEAGGREEPFAELEASIEQAIAGLRI